MFEAYTALHRGFGNIYDKSTKKKPYNLIKKSSASAYYYTIHT